MKTISILGLGLMGGSLGLALRQAGKNVRVQAFARREETRQEALERGMADAVFADPAVAVQGADLVVACVPVCRIPEVLEAALPGLADGVLVTDVGSSKAWLTQACRTVLADSGAVFVGSHPMCGSERTGLEAADA
jgi:prephenate dehydrogenase